MSGLNSDQLHRSTLGIYSSLMDEFNPGLQKLVSLGKSYMQAFQAFADTSEAYFTALSKIGENALNTTSSRSLGDVLIQISETQRRLTVELGGVFRRFDTEVIQSMNNNIRLDRDYMTTSRRQYEMEVQNLTRYMRRGVNQDYNEYMQFLQRSHDEALKEQERRQRFLAEKHCGLMQSFAQLMNKTGGLLLQRTDMWTQDVNAHRGVEARRPSSVASFEDTSKFREEPILGSIPSRVPSPLGNSSRSSFDSAGGGSSGGRTMRALVAHQPGASNKTLLAFSKGETITVLVQQSRNGWLYGRTDSSSRPGWFPSTYVKAVDDPPSAISHRNPLRNDSSNNLSSSDQPRSRNLSGSAPPPVPPPLSGLPSERRSEMQPAPSNSEQKRSKPQDSRPELFPRGTNPFATVKLKPTQTNDRSAPRLYR